DPLRRRRGVETASLGSGRPQLVGRRLLGQVDVLERERPELEIEIEPARLRDVQDPMRTDACPGAQEIRPNQERSVRHAATTSWSNRNTRRVRSTQWTYGS